MGRFEFYGQGLPAVEASELKGKLVVVEGTDGVGRSTHIGLLKEWPPLAAAAVPSFLFLATAVLMMVWIERLRPAWVRRRA